MEENIVKLQTSKCLKISTHSVNSLTEVANVLRLIDKLYSLLVLNESFYSKSTTQGNIIDANRAFSKDIQLVEEKELVKSTFTMLSTETPRDKTTLYYLKSNHYAFQKSRILYYDNVIFSNDLLSRLSKSMKEDSKIKIIKIEANSPVIILLKGLAEMIVSIAEVLKIILFFKKERTSRDLDNKLKEEELKIKKLETIRKYYDFIKNEHLKEFIAKNNDNQVFFEQMSVETLNVLGEIKKIETVPIED